MIGSLQGKVLRIDGVTALIEVGGVGYEVDMPVTCLGNLKVGENTFVFIQHVVREDAQILYGFSTRARKRDGSFGFERYNRNQDERKDENRAFRQRFARTQNASDNHCDQS